MSTDQEFIHLFQQLDPERRRSLMDFGRFLLQQQQAPTAADEQVEASAPSAAAQEPVAIPRPAKETIVEAIRRLTNTYPMLDKARLLNETSGLVAQHVMQGRNLTEVITDLEGIFHSHYLRYREKQGQS